MVEVEWRIVWRGELGRCSPVSTQVWSTWVLWAGATLFPPVHLPYTHKISHHHQSSTPITYRYTPYTPYTHWLLFISFLTPHIHPAPGSNSPGLTP
jgi:hypothetical protein